MRGRLVALAALFYLQGFLAAQSLTIYTEISPPGQFLGPHGQLTGHATEIVREIQRRTGNTDPIEVVPWVRGYKEVQSRPNVILFSVARSPERDPLFEWVGPLNENSYGFYVKAWSRTLEAMKRDGTFERSFRRFYPGRPLPGSSVTP